ncbi:MAG: S46 family peptidase [Acidobacteria bacterium]|nr:S46 family peptidase [Acidobacteriota bacterium]
MMIKKHLFILKNPCQLAKTHARAIMEAMHRTLTLLFAATFLPATADEGMWLLNRFPAEEVKKKFGVTLTPAFMDHLRLSAVRFNNGGSGSFVSADGLLFTNHHVGADCIYKVSSKDHDYMKDGFLAKSQADEKACPDLEVNILLRIDPATDKVNAGVNDAMPPAEANRVRRANIAKLESECAKSTGNRCDIVTLYSGGQYDLYIYKKYTDVRLVFAPEESIAAFGGDPDNFTFPRFCLDFALFRAYENGKPVEPEHFLKWSKTGARDGELIFVSGHPGSTERMATVAQLEFQRDAALPYSREILKKLADRLIAFGAEDGENKRIARDVLASVQNSFKAFTGFYAGLKDDELIRLKREAETKLRKAVADDPAKQAKYGKIWDDISAYVDEYKRFYVPYSLFERAPVTGSEFFNIAKSVNRYAVEKAKPNTERLRAYADAALPQLEMAMYSTAPIYPKLEELLMEEWIKRMVEKLGVDHDVVKKVLNGRSPRDAAKYYVGGAKLIDVAERKRLAADAAAAAASADTMIELARILDGPGRLLRRRFEDKVEAVQVSSASRIAQTRFAIYGANEYPDATFTLRVSFAPVKGYTNAAGAKVPWATDFTGLYARATGQEPFALPDSWKNAKPRLRLKTPYNFVSTADTHGGNSGSPTVNTKGEVVGILFDGNIEGLPNQYLYRDKMERSVHVASQGIVESLRSVYKADRILKELGF